ncbi:PAS domain-containing protein [Bosea sp. OAE752]|uniref:PAS domain-containing protein n=1 Tax=Bosea sp. OAE752 TaxID=2663873 RepID=UPI003D1B11B9
MHANPFEDIYQNAPSGYLVIAPNGRIAMANRTAAAWLAYEPEGLIGRGLFDVLTLVD